MCPRFNNGLCSVAGIEPKHVECVDRGVCYEKREYEICRLYMIDSLMACKMLLNSKR